jgi:hypothetical protein
MNFQLVLQWTTSCIDNFDVLIEIEDSLIAEFGSQCEIDGHDMGAHEVNIFILTEEVEVIFDKIKFYLEFIDRLKGMKAGYRNLDSSDYLPLWPQSLSEFSVA